MLVKVENVYVGKYDVDSIEFYEDGIKKEICFDKSAHVGTYLGKSVELKEVNGIIKIFPYDGTDKPYKPDKVNEKANPKK